MDERGERTAREMDASTKRLAGEGGGTALKNREAVDSLDLPGLFACVSSNLSIRPGMWLKKR